MDWCPAASPISFEHWVVYKVSLFQMGTHPMLCASPIAYQVVNAAEEAVMKLQ
jgi:hypothetical protein